MANVEIQLEESLLPDPFSGYLPAVSWISVILAFAAVSLSWLVARLFHVRFKNRLAAVLRSSEVIQKGSSSKLTVEDLMREEQEREYHRQQKLKASITPLSHSRINPLAKSTGILLTGDGLASSFILPHSSFSTSSTDNSATSSPASSVPSSPSTLRASTGQSQGQVVTEEIQTKRKVAALVSSVRLFQFLEDPALRELAQLFTQRSIHKNEVLFGRTADGKNEIPEHELVVVVSGCIHIVLDSISKPPPAPRRRPRRRSSLQMDPTAIAALLANVAAAASDTSSPPTSTEQHHIPPPQPIRKQQMLSVQKPGRCVTSVHAMLEKMTIWSDEEDEDESSDDETTTTGGPSTSTSYANLNSTSNQDGDNTDEVDEVITAIAAEDSVIATVDFESPDFLELLRKYPKAFTKMKRVFATRLQRVTLHLMQRYFDLADHFIDKRASPWQSTRSKHGSETMTTPGSPAGSYQEQAFKGLCTTFGFDPSSDPSLGQILREAISIQSHRPGDVLLQPPEDYSPGDSSDYDSLSEPALFYVIQGQLQVHFLNEEEEKDKTDGRASKVPEFVANPGEMAGHLAAVTGEIYYKVIAAVGDGDRPLHISSAHSSPKIITAKISKRWFDRLVDEKPILISKILSALLNRLSPLVKQLDCALDWTYVNAGDVIFREGDPTDSMYVVLGGRVRLSKAVTGHGGARARSSSSSSNLAVFSQAGKARKKSLFGSIDTSNEQLVVGDFGRGESIGALDVMTDAPRNNTATAMRDAELVRVSAAAFKLVVSKYPRVVFRFANIIRQTVDKQLLLTAGKRDGAEVLGTVAVVALTDGVPLGPFTKGLAAEVNQIVPSLHLDKSAVLEFMGKESFSSTEEVRLVRWLAEQEERYRVVIYESDKSNSAWTRRCIRQADCILLVAWTDDPVALSEIEKFILRETIKTNPRKELVLLHPDGVAPPQGTLRWLELRQGWCTACHHIRFDIGMLRRQYTWTRMLDLDSRTADIKGINKIQRVVQKVVNEVPALIKKEVPQLLKRGAEEIWNRFSNRNKVRTAGKIFTPALVLNPKNDLGRIARRITGTAVGLVLGGGGARGLAHIGVIKALEENNIPIDFIGGTSIGSFIGGLYAKEPSFIDLVARGKKFSKVMSSKWAKVLDLTYPRTAFFTGGEFNRGIQGSLGEDTLIEDLWINYFCVTTNITRSEMNIHRDGPLWRYVRGSMTLAGFLPPIPDTEGNLLVDGGYVNNLPADVMRQFGIKHIIAVDVGAEDDTNYFNYGDSLNGWWLLWQSWKPWGTKVRIPNMSDIQGLLAYVSCVRQLEFVKEMKNCHYLRPPVMGYATLEFHKFEEIVEVGYKYAIAEIKKLKARGAALGQPLRKPLYRRVQSAEGRLSDLVGTSYDL